MKHLDDETLEAYVSKELQDTSVQSAVERHLDECTECSRLVHAYQQFAGELSGIESPAPSPELVGSVMRRIEGAQQVKRESGLLFWLQEWGMQFAGVALSLLVLVSVSYQEPSALEGEFVESEIYIDESEIFSLASVLGVPSRDGYEQNF